MNTTFEIYNLYKFDTLNIHDFRNEQDIKKIKKQVALTIKNKQLVCKMLNKQCFKGFYNGAV